MQRFIRYIAVVILITVCLAIPVSAADNVEQRSSYYFMSYSVYLWEPTNEAWFEVTAVDTMDKLGASEIKIQRSTDQTNWTTVKTFKMENYPQMIEEDTVTTANCVSYTFTNGYYYRGVVTLYAKKGNETGYSTVVTPTLNKR